MSKASEIRQKRAGRAIMRALSNSVEVNAALQKLFIHPNKQLKLTIIVTEHKQACLLEVPSPSK
jgi:hypothetical protein